MQNKKNDYKKRVLVAEEASDKKNSANFLEKRTKIIKKAARLFMKNGYAQTSMREISGATGIELSNLYNFINSKEEILFLTFNMIHSPLSNLFDNYKISDITNPEVQLRTAIRELAKINYEYKGEVLLLYRESKILPKKYLKIILSRETEMVCQFEDIIKRIAEEKPLKIVDSSYAANLIVFYANFYPLKRWNMRKYTKEEIMDLTENTIMNLFFDA
jgi:AcrR family transcriptional regulator